MALKKAVFQKLFVALSSVRIALIEVETKLELKRYEYKCRCDSRYVGRTSRRLQDRIKQHVPKWLMQNHTISQRLQPDRTYKKKKKNTPEYDSAIGQQHLLASSQCAANYYEFQFSVLDTAHSRFYLSLLEATYIKIHRPNLCRQKELVYTLNLFK